jgi:hypothetical protein
MGNVKIKNKSFLNFSNQKKINLFTGWNKSCILRINLKKNNKINSRDLFKKIKNFNTTEKLIIIKKGKIKILLKNKNFILKKLDGLNTFSKQKFFEVQCISNSEFFIIFSLTADKTSGAPYKFNFMKDLKLKNLWGGKCLSRVYYGKKINVVFFNLKKGFKFCDNGHKNEQITWLIKGKMRFYSNKLKKILNSENIISIGKMHVHGGYSDGAVGFDAFFPKRSEPKYLT